MRTDALPRNQIPRTERSSRSRSSVSSFLFLKLDETRTNSPLNVAGTEAEGTVGHWSPLPCHCTLRFAVAWLIRTSQGAREPGRSRQPVRERGMDPFYCLGYSRPRRRANINPERPTRPTAAPLPQVNGIREYISSHQCWGASSALYGKMTEGRSYISIPDLI